MAQHAGNKNKFTEHDLHGTDNVGVHRNMPLSDELLSRYRNLVIRRGTYQREDSRKVNRTFDQRKDVGADVLLLQPFSTRSYL